MGIHATDDTNSDLRTPLRTQGGLRQLVGYAELIKAASVSRSTIERAWRGHGMLANLSFPNRARLDHARFGRQRMPMRGYLRD